MKTILTVLLAVVTPSISLAEDWTGFRGSRGNGVTSANDLPVRWNADEGIRWSVPLPQGGNGSPVVAGNRVFVTSAEDSKGQRRALFCFDTKSGDTLWSQAVSIDETMPTHKTNPYGGSTPATDGKIVVVWHGSAGLHAYTISGEPIWSADLGEFRHMWGYGTSPVIDGNRVILSTGPGKDVFVAAFDLGSGNELWRHVEPVDGDGERNSDGKYMGSWSTPIIIDQDGKSVAVCAMAKRVCGLDATSGEVLWYCNGLAGPKGDLAYSSPMIEGDLCVMAGGFSGPSIGFRLQGSGNITNKSRLWRLERNPQSIGTGLLREGYVYRPGAGPNLIECIQGDTGEIIWQERAGSKAFWGSIVFDGQHAFLTNQAGETIVFKPSPEGYRKVASNPLDDTCNATPAVADGTIYIRTYKKLWCIDGV